LFCHYNIVISMHLNRKTALAGGFSEGS